MSCFYKIDHLQNLISSNFKGNVTVAQLIAHDEKILADPKFQKEMNSLCDITTAMFNWTLQDIDRYRNHVMRTQNLIGLSKWAVISAGGVTEHTAKIFSALHGASDDVIEMKVFNDRTKAMDWLKPIKHCQSDEDSAKHKHV